MSTTNNPRTKLGYEEYALFPNDGNRHEVIDGDHYMNPAPSTYHQTISKRLLSALYSEIELTKLGIVFNAPIDVQLGDHDIVQPDLLVMLNESTASVTPSRIKGAPDLLIEILSPSTAKNDRTLKRSLYERSGVREYWVVDPEAHSITQLVLNDGKFESQSPGETIQLAILPELGIELSTIW